MMEKTCVIIPINGGPDDPPPISINTTVSSQCQQLLAYGEEATDQSTVSEEHLERWRLRRIINERCVSLLNEFIHTAAVSVSKQLDETDNLLMKSQVVLQNTTCAVKKINETTELMASKLQGALSFNFIPQINVKLHV
ncbi:uncharacterized protein LOC135717332 isoform X2 [Ochlerotatus camptorhynchus]|uniref:uncharacterized protein LOC135717332 isoform X2 n=1 Tax=Ochlerotatus camptorhynchus TaxID=644619 RepID=UPI0031D0D977